VTTCPTRFVADVEDGRSLFNWISGKMLDTVEPIIVKETPFLRKVSDSRLPVEAIRNEEVAADVEEEEEAEKKAGRIDWLVVNPASMSANDLEWAAVETQALYFSGGKMITEFQAYAAARSDVLFPLGKRRPDYRSSGPKRLSPQLDVKGDSSRMYGPPHDCKGKAVEREDKSAQMYAAFSGDRLSWP
jgi:hypothetical protein